MSNAKKLKKIAKTIREKGLKEQAGILEKIADEILIIGPGGGFRRGPRMMGGPGPEMAGKGRMIGTRPGAGPGGVCICPECDYTEPHEVGVPCYSKKCPKCGIPLVRG
jgi:hypothetical protein